MNGVVFDIKEFSIHDGPGARFTVFLKGCPLRCIWCHNPEGLEKKKQLLYKEKDCVKCGMCMAPCSHSDCKEFDRCLHICPNNCLSVAGREYTADELAKTILDNKDFFELSGGGVTFSGGEPLMQAEFLLEVMDKLKDVHIAIQTSGYADSETYLKVIEKADFIMQDIKLADANLHKKYTGVGNEKILFNIESLKKSGKNFVFRVPLIPDITDTEENLKAISKIVGDFETELLKYNDLAGAKYPSLGLEYSPGNIKNREEDFTKYFKNAKIR